MPEKPREINLLELLAVNSTKPSCLLLRKYDQGKPKDYAHLQEKLADLYAEHPDKVAIEKEFADIHPHKEWILKHCKGDKGEQAPKEIVLSDGTHAACGCQHSSFDGTGSKAKEITQGHRALELVVTLGLGILIGATVYRMATR